MASLSTSAGQAGRGRRSERATIAFLAFLGVLLAFGIDVALPAFDEIRESFGLSPNGGAVSLIGTTYFLGMAVGQLIYGPLSDRFGRIPALQAGLALYAVGAVGSALAPTFELMLAARVLWGLGAAAPGGLRTAIARDLYEGDQMARVVTIVMAVFLIGPIFVPLIGEGLLRVGPWQLVFFSGFGLAAVASAATAWFGETLDPSKRRPLGLGQLREAARLVFTTRQTIGHIAAQTFLAAAFFIFLGSAQPIFDQIYGRADSFAAWFGGLGVVIVAFLVVNNRLIRMFGARQMALWAAAALVAVNAVGVVVAVAGGGVPPFLVWLAVAGLGNALMTVLTPLCTSLALEPMGALAGTASALLGFITLAGGAVLAAIVDSLITTTVTPMAVGYLVYGVLGFIALLMAGRQASSPGKAVQL